MEKYIDYLIEWLQNKVKETNTKGIVVGVSGGIDSAVVANLIKRAFPDNSIGIIMPCYSKDEDVEHAKLVIDKIDLNNITVNLDNSFDSIVNAIEPNIEVTNSFSLSKANTKARLRMTTLYAIAQNYNYLVCGTDNACEWFTGYFTKYGDGGADIAPLIHLTKTQVYEMARLLSIDDVIINKTPSAGLVGNQSDEDEMQVTYMELEAYMNNEKVSEKAKERIEFLHKISEHKRNIVSTPLKKVEDLK